MEKKRSLHIDILRIISMLAVIFLHTVADLLRVNYRESVWHFSNVVTTFMSTSVPVFFMISGALLLGAEKTNSVSYTLKKRLPKMVFPFLFWSLFAIIYYLVVGYFYQGKEWQIPQAMARLTHLLSQPVTVHLWFMYALIPIYLISPLLKAMMDKLSKNGQNYCFVLWLVFSVGLPSLYTFAPGSYKEYFSLNPSFSLNIFSGYIGFFLLGHLLNTRNVTIKKRTLFLFILADIFFVSLATYLYTSYQGEYYEGFKTYSLVFTASLSAALFLLVKKKWGEKQPSPGFSKLLSTLSSISFAVYLMHNLVIHFFSLNYFLVPNQGILWVMLRFLVVFIVSFVLTVILASIRPLCFVATGLSFAQASQSCNIQFFLGVVKNKNKKN